MSGRLVLAGTPIGDVGDASARLGRVLAEADVVAAEDTRRLKRLTSELGIQVGGRVVSYFEGNERERTPELLEALQQGQTVVVVTDAGMPSVSDPGYRLVAAAIEADVDVTADPEGHLISRAAALDIVGKGVDDFSPAFRAEVLRDFPRHGLSSEFLTCFQAQADRKANSSAARAIQTGLATRIAANPLDVATP